MANTKENQRLQIKKLTDKIQSEETKRAFQILMKLSDELDCEIRPYPHGEGGKDNVHFLNNEAQAIYAVIVNLKWLLFYLRNPDSTHPHLTIKDFQNFEEARVNNRNEFAFRIKNERQARLLIEILGAPSDPTEKRDLPPKEIELLDDLQRIDGSAENATERESLRLARIGQGKFRNNVFEMWGNACCVTGNELPTVLRASHIKPWRESDDDERLDPNNGLPLVANLDLLFDDGLITFNNEGSLLVSKRVDDESKAKLQLDNLCLMRPPKAEMLPYLEYHRQHIFVD